MRPPEMPRHRQADAGACMYWYPPLPVPETAAGFSASHGYRKRRQQGDVDPCPTGTRLLPVSEMAAGLLLPSVNGSGVTSVNEYPWPARSTGRTSGFRPHRQAVLKRQATRHRPANGWHFQHGSAGRRSWREPASESFLRFVLALQEMTDESDYAASEGRL